MKKMVNTAVILAAGVGSRFGARTQNLPKGLIEVGNLSMIIRSIEILIDCGITRIVIGTGYQSQMYQQVLADYPQVEFCYNKDYMSTNSMWTLWTCEVALINCEGFLLLESDIVYEKRAVIDLMKSVNSNIILASDVIKFQDSYFIEADSNSHLKTCSPNLSKNKCFSEMVGIHKISNKFYAKMLSMFSSGKEKHKNIGYEEFISKVANQESTMLVMKIKNLVWYEIDDERDLKYAEEMIVPQLGN
jgi:choline kinase